MTDIVGKRKQDRTSLLKPLLFLALLVCLSIGVFLFVSQHHMNSLFDGVEEQYRQGLINVVSVARNAAGPVLAQVRSGEIDREEAIRRLRPMIRSMAYQDRDGMNYVFMSDYDGTMLVQPFEPDMEMINQLDLRDVHGVYIIRELIRAAKTRPGGSFVRYHYYIPAVHEVQEKLSYVVGLPEIGCYIGTGMYMKRTIEEQREILSKIWYAFIWLLAAVLIPVSASIFFIISRNNRLLAEIGIREKAEGELKKSEEKYRSIFENSAEGIFQADPEGRIINVNPMFARLAGYRSPREMVDADPRTSQFYEDPHDRERLLGILREKGFVADHEVRLKRRDGTTFWASLNTRMVRDEKGAVLYFEGTLDDITERKHAEEEREKLQGQLLQSRKLEAVGTLAGGIAHDFNNMLGVIIGYAELMLGQMDSGNPYRENPGKILEAAQRSAGLTRQLLAFARRQTVTPVVFDLNESVESTLKMLRRLIGENIALAWMPGAGPCTVKMDPSQLDQLLANLCVNARDAIGEVGRISIETGTVSVDGSGSGSHGGLTPGEYVTLAISDDGCGMDRETMEHMFEPFFTTKRLGHGTGLGLATVYGIVKQNGGSIDVHSEPGKGSSFRICIPRHLTDAGAGTADAAGEIPRGSGETVLFVEDDPTLLEMGRMMLQHLGYSVLPAASPGEAIRLAGEGGREIRLFITDVVMPGMNGKELAERLLELRPGMNHLFMSGYTADVIAHQGVLEEGVNFIQKPFSMKDLADKIREVL
ncbi:MAG: cache domain-containing protein [Deltaproteobacteria bacterium]|nr:cache domain-containing protein [Deltaproteobacteria bacterium]